MSRSLPTRWAAALLVGCAACSQEPDLVVYCSLDQGFSEPLLRSFEEESGLRVEPQYDVERNKTVGLVNRIIAEAEHPRCDVYWNNEIAHTIRLKREGLTEAYRSPAAEGIPERFRDPEGHWTGFAARARVVMYRTDEEGPVPETLDDFLDPEFAQRGAMALPVTGTTLTNFAVLSELRGEQEVLDWLRRAGEAGLSFGAGNADVMRRTREGDFLWCFTDTDDAAKAEDAGYPVAIRYLDQGGGALLIPNTVAIIRGAPHRDAAERFVDWVLSAEVERRLAHADSRQIPLRPGVEAPERVGVPGEDFTPLPVDWEAAADLLEERERAFRELLVR